jgi:isochorismate synthase
LAPNAFDLVDHLRETYPQCHVFVWQVGESTLVGASPELLLAMTGRSVRVNPLAGSARRGEGEADDRALGEALMHSAKDRHEHDLVVQDIADRLSPVVKELHIPSKPSLRRMATVQHLSSEIVGRTAHTIHPLDLVDIMHPTPAVGGTPRNAALAFVDKIEGIDRGWYAGGIGWLTAGGDATFAIPLRCALIRGNTASLYAGAGIVGESRPESELDETRLKFRPMLSILTAT